jgi:hypothetical protein
MCKCSIEIKTNATSVLQAFEEVYDFLVQDLKYHENIFWNDSSAVQWLLARHPSRIVYDIKASQPLCIKITGKTINRMISVTHYHLSVDDCLVIV